MLILLQKPAVALKKEWQLPKKIWCGDFNSDNDNLNFDSMISLEIREQITKLLKTKLLYLELATLLCKKKKKLVNILKQENLCIESNLENDIMHNLKHRVSSSVG